MFAAASGARLAHRHAKPATVKKQASAGQIEGLHIKQFQQPKIRLDGPNLGPGALARQQLKPSILDLNARIPKLDFEGEGLSNRRDPPESTSSNRNQGKAAWQDRELGHDGERHDSLEVTSDGASTHRSKQKEAHRRWVKRNRIHDSSVGDCSSDEDEVYSPYGVQSAAANTLLYVGLGTMAVGTIIAFVGTGEKGFKTLELRLIGPSLIAAGVFVVILRIALCVCPFHCLKHKHKQKHKQKHKNSTNKLNSEDISLIQAEKPKTVVTATSPPPPPPPPQPPPTIENRDITATVSFLECERAVELKPLSPPPVKPTKTPQNDVSVTSLTNGVLTNTETDPPSQLKVKKLSKFETARVPKNLKQGELLLSPVTLEDVQEDS